MSPTHYALLALLALLLAWVIARALD